MRLTVQRLLLLLLALVIAGAIVYAFLPRPTPVDMIEVVRGPLRVTVDEDGRTRIKERYEVSSPLAGRLRRIRLRAGDEVQTGETLLALIGPTDPTLLDARARAEAAARVRAAEAALERTGPNLEAALAALQFAETEYNRARQLHERNTITRRELDEASLVLRQRTEEYRSARFSEEIARFELEQARAALLQTAPEDAEIPEPAETPGNSETPDVPVSEDRLFEIRAPITGRVLRVFQESETVVTPGTRLLELGDTTDLEIEIDVLSSDAVAIEPGAHAILEHWGGEEPLSGMVRLVEPSAFTKVSALGVEEQRVNVIIDLLDPPEERRTLGDGFRVEARIVVWERDDVLKVPTSALFRHEERWSVFVVDDGRARLRRVQIGRRSGLEAEVLEGLQAGELVIAHPSDRIEEGVTVTPR